MKVIKFGVQEIGHPMRPYIIAEIGVNHGGDMALAKRLIREAKAGGAHAAKFQSYKAEKIASKNSPAYWDTNKEATKSQYQLFKKFDAFGPEQYRELATYCREQDIAFMSTPFDLEAVDWLAPLMDAFKIASADITNVPLLRKCAAQGKPLLISTGAATLPEIEFALHTARSAGAREIVLLHCVLNYPTELENAALNMISVLQRTFPECLIGYSDHVAPDDTISVMQAATVLGACVLEKHFTHDKTLPGNDHYHAMDQHDLKRFTQYLDSLSAMVGQGGKDLGKEEAARKHARRSIVAAHNLKAGQVLTEADIIAKRPAHGISPVHWDEVLGRTIRHDIEDDTLLQWHMLEGPK
jgi:sialic acid synthase SpsE